MTPQAAPVAFIQRAVAERFKTPLIEMRSERRDREAARPRQVAYYLARELTTFSLPNIGRMFGGRDHTTIIHGIRRVKQLIASDPETAESVSTLRAEIEAALSTESAISTAGDSLLTEA